MPHPPRPQPLEAAPVDEPAHPVASRRRAALVGLGMGVAVGLAAVGIAFSIVAIPMFVVASTEPGSGLNRHLVRTGLFQVAVPFGVVTGVVVGLLVGVWYARGGRLPTDRTPLDL